MRKGNDKRERNSIGFASMFGIIVVLSQPPARFTVTRICNFDRKEGQEHGEEQHEVEEQEEQ